jgi:predicted membrane-bound spermidine synthase
LLIDGINRGHIECQMSDKTTAIRTMMVLGGAVWMLMGSAVLLPQLILLQANGLFPGLMGLANVFIGIWIIRKGIRAK